jgi:hypothetical protein
MTASVEDRPVWSLWRLLPQRRQPTRPVFALYQRSILRARECQDVCNAAREYRTQKAQASRKRRHKVGSCP